MPERTQDSQWFPCSFNVNQAQFNTLGSTNEFSVSGGLHDMKGVPNTCNETNAALTYRACHLNTLVPTLAANEIVSNLGKYEQKWAKRNV